VWTYVFPEDVEIRAGDDRYPVGSRAGRPWLIRIDDAGVPYCRPP
jgi:hypothetical protein